MPVEHFLWTIHARVRIGQRRLERGEVEDAIRARHELREVNDGRAQWLVRGVTEDDGQFEVIYDHPHDDDLATARIVSVWRVLE